MRRRRVVVTLGACIVLAILVGLGVFAETDSLSYRLAQSENLNGAKLDSPPIWSWPRISYSHVFSHADFYNAWRASDVQSRVVQLGWLVSDDYLAGLVGTNVPNRPSSSAEVPLPRLVWVVRWQSTCLSTPPAGFHGCYSYDIIDDATGMELDSGQAWR